MAILLSYADIAKALRRVEELRLSPLPVESKAWDNVFAIEAIRAHGIAPDEPVADLGCRSGIVLTWLDELGYRRLYGCDLRAPYPPIRSAIARGNVRTAAHAARMYVRNRRRMVIASAEDTPFPGGTFAAVTAMSVIEHGVDVRSFIEESARLLRSRGLLVVSTDYWPTRIDTNGVRRFAHTHGEDRVFSAHDIEELVEDASAHGLNLVGDLELAAVEPVIDSAGLRYTFIALLFERE